MEQQHRDAIRKSFSSLVEQTDLDLMVTVLYEKGVFSEAMIEPYKDNNKDVRNRKRQLYRDITRRGPHAFGHLLDALMENGYWDLVRDLDPKSSLNPKHPRQGGNFLSIFDQKRNTGKEQNDPNSNQHNSTTHRSSWQDRENQPEEEPTPGASESPAGAGGDASQSSTIPQFDVIKSTKFFEDNSNGDIKLYRTRGPLRGVLLQFSYIAFANNIETYREGARVDMLNLRYLFTELGFKVVAYTNLSLQDTKHTLETLPNSICAETVFVVFSSHGYARSGSGDTDIRCSDGHLISYYQIIDYFNNENFPALNGIPKVFIFQTCRGSNKNYVLAPKHLPAPGGARARAARGERGGRTAQDGRRYESSSDSDDEPERRIDKSVERMYSDILIAHSTVPGYASNRDKVSGSWYIQALCEVFAARAHDCHVEKLFTLVDQQLQRRFRQQTSSVDRWGFNRRLYLHPGLYEDLPSTQPSTT